MFIFFFKQKTAYEMRISDWSSDVCSSDLGDGWAAYGLGLAISRLHDGPLLRHGGGGRGWRLALALAPRQDVGVMVMAAAETPAIEGLAMDLLATVGLGRSRAWRGVFTGAATHAAIAARRALATRFPSGAPAPVPLRPGGSAT